mmetsp:Transcript_19663/g.28614  ORF Transcript_19663/g.28614 Transcript_19663/m.28614 type:complete len:330 (-) Transcript_19663:654-1643(-)
MRHVLGFGFACGTAVCRVQREGRSRSFGRRFATSMAVQVESLGSKFKIALLQVSVGADKQANLSSARKKIEEARANESKLVMLPECFNCPYDNKYFPEYAEEVPEVGTKLGDFKPGSTVEMLQKAAAEHSLYIVGGSIPEISEGKVYNTSVSVSPTGTIIAKHRKVHLFDIDVPGGIRFMESEVLSAGNSLTTFEVGGMKIGVAICYDVRFPELSLLLSGQGAKLLCIPGAFNMTTGPAHWELLMRARALDNQMYVAACSPARDPDGSYVAWGHSMVCNPWGMVIAEADETEQIVYSEIDLERLTEVRQSIPVTKQKRSDIYAVTGPDL